nr:alpha-glucosidase C-terminal domain-containing protein [Rhizomicrobium palustre]
MEFLSVTGSVLAFTRKLAGETVLCVFNLGREDSVFDLAGFNGAAALDIACGAAQAKDGALRLAPLSAWFGIL